MIRSAAFVDSTSLPPNTRRTPEINRNAVQQDCSVQAPYTHNNRHRLQQLAGQYPTRSIDLRHPIGSCAESATKARRRPRGPATMSLRFHVLTGAPSQDCSTEIPLPPQSERLPRFFRSYLFSIHRGSPFLSSAARLASAVLWRRSRCAAPRAGASVRPRAGGAPTVAQPKGTRNRTERRSELPAEAASGLNDGSGLKIERSLELIFFDFKKTGRTDAMSR
jgi:hypothetical protein